MIQVFNNINILTYSSYFFVSVKVRLIHGVAPKGLKMNFYSEFQILGFIEMEHNIFAMPLQKDDEVIPIPDNTKLKVVTAKNLNQLEKLSEYLRLLNKAQKYVDEYMTKSLRSIYRQNEKKGTFEKMRNVESRNNPENSKYGHNLIIHF